MGAFEALLAGPTAMLGEGSMYERLRRHPGVDFDPHIAHAGLIYGERERELVADVHRQYIAVAQAARLPMLVTTGSWRASAERLARSAFAERDVNGDQVAFVKDLCARETGKGSELFVGAVMGAHGDAYRPQEALNAADAQRKHAEQALRLSDAAPDMMLAGALPALAEALGLARLLEQTTLPYMIGFVVRPDGTLLDRTRLSHAIARIDDDTPRPPIGYVLTCVHPTVHLAALSAEPEAATRVVGLKANTSAKSPEELAMLDELDTQAPDVFGAHVASVLRRHALSLVAGCCGTNTAHLQSIAAAVSEATA